MTPSPTSSADLTTQPLADGDELVLSSGPAFGAATVVLTLGDGSAGDDLAGASSLAMQLLDRGTGSHDRRAFYDALELLGASVHLRAGRGTSSIEVRGLEAVLPEAVDLVIEAMRDPADDEDEWDAVLDELADDAERAVEDPSGAVGQALAPCLWPGRAWGRPVDGTQATRAELELDDVRAARARLFGARARIGVSGDDATRLTEVALRWHDALRSLSPARGVEPPKTPSARFGALATIEMDDPQAGMSIAWSAPGVHDDAWPAVALHHAVYAGGFTSPLVRRIRAEAGLSYDVISDLIGGREASLQVLEISPEATEVGRVFDEVAACWATFVDRALTPDEVETARERLLGSHAIGLETVRQRLRAAINQRWLGRPVEALTTLPERIRALTIAELEAAATRWGPGAGPCTAVVAAPGDALADAARASGLDAHAFDLDTIV